MCLPDVFPDTFLAGRVEFDTRANAILRTDRQSLSKRKTQPGYSVQRAGGQGNRNGKLNFKKITHVGTSRSHAHENDASK